MSATVTTSGLNRTITFSYTAVIAKVDQTILECAEYLFDNGFYTQDPKNPKVFTDLTNAEKLAMVDAHVKKAIIDVAKTQHIISAKKIAGETATIEAETLFINGG